MKRLPSVKCHKPILPEGQVFFRAASTGGLVNITHTQGRNTVIHKLKMALLETLQ